MPPIALSVPPVGQPIDHDCGRDLSSARSRAANDPINPTLIAIALVYLAWSWFHLPSSIWARLLLASVLIVRMRPDIIIPYSLTCLQLRLHLFASERAGADPYSDPEILAGLTGFESYAFSIPPVLMMVMTVQAFVGVRKGARRFPNGLFLLWLFGSLFVLAGAVESMANGRGWTGSIRIYSVVGACFYGMLMPTLDQRQMTRLAAGLAWLGMTMCVLYMTLGFWTHVLFMCMPLVAVWSVGGLLTGPRRVLSAIMLCLTGYLCLFTMTFMASLTWLWGAGAGVVEHFLRPRPRRPVQGMAWMVGTTVVVCALLFCIGVTQKIAEKEAGDGTLLSKFSHKLLRDRGPIWAGCLQLIIESPTLLAMPERPYIVQWFGREELWRWGPHNLELDLLRQLGVIAGPIAALVLASVVCSLVIVIQNDATRGSRALATAAICCIVVGGLTLPYIVRDRVGETMLMSAGLVIASYRVRAAADRTSRPLAGHDGRSLRWVA